MTSALTLAARAAIVAATLGAIFGALALVGHIQLIWGLTLAAVGLFYGLCYLLPERVYHAQSMPYTYYIRNNLGNEGFQFQNITYAAYHNHWYNHVTHAALSIEAVLWMVAAFSILGPLGAVGLLGLMLYQALQLAEQPFGWLMVLVWLGVFLLAGGMWQVFGASTALLLAQYGLVGFGFWRYTGHMVEPVPPGIVDNDGFVDPLEVGADKRLLLPAALGYVSEFSAGVPGRLFVNWVFMVAQALGYTPRVSPSWAEARQQVPDIHQRGWQAHPLTARLVVASQRPLADGV